MSCRTAAQRVLPARLQPMWKLPPYPGANPDLCPKKVVQGLEQSRNPVWPPPKPPQIYCKPWTCRKNCSFVSWWSPSAVFAPGLRDVFQGGQETLAQASDTVLFTKKGLNSAVGSMRMKPKGWNGTKHVLPGLFTGRKKIGLSSQSRRRHLWAGPVTF